MKLHAAIHVVAKREVNRAPTDDEYRRAHNEALAEIIKSVLKVANSGDEFRVVGGCDSQVALKMFEDAKVSYEIDPFLPPHVYQVRPL